ncbi:unnamed protein product [Trichobilharzia regenti]|nr:unnamed protein product [Trichobilharzia regenti]
MNVHHQMKRLLVILIKFECHCMKTKSHGGNVLNREMKKKSMQCLKELKNVSLHFIFFPIYCFFIHRISPIFKSDFKTYPPH